MNGAKQAIVPWQKLKVQTYKQVGIWFKLIFHKQDLIYMLDISAWFGGGLLIQITTKLF